MSEETLAEIEFSEGERAASYLRDAVNKSNPAVAALIKIAELYENNQMRSTHELGAIAYDMRCIARNALEKVK